MSQCPDISDEILLAEGDPGGELARARSAAMADLRKLYSERADFVRRVIIRLGGPRADVDDLVHDVFLIALRKRDSFEGRAAPTTWLYSVAVKVVAGARRRARIRQLFGLEDAYEPTERETPASVFEHREASRIVYRLLDRIGEKKRTVFILFELEGLSGEEIAEAVGCPLKTVWTRLFHARREFAELLGKTSEREGWDAPVPIRRGVRSGS
jgi:RNA polymerase sigma-70 factor (ECF subfamily)